MAERRDDGRASGPAPDAGRSIDASTGSAAVVMWTTVVRRVIFGLLVGALVSALGVRLAMDVAQITALDAEEGPSVMRIAGKSAAVRMYRAQPPTARDRGGRRGE